jgi:DNA polymerase-3 subunit epsilon
MDKKDFDRDTAILAARYITTNPYMVIDTETTGLVLPLVCQIGWMNELGERRVELIKPRSPIEPGAEAVHHISNDMVKDARQMQDVLREIVVQCAGRCTVFYNTPFDTKAISNSIQTEYKPSPSYDAMLLYAAFRGQWDAFRGSYRWAKLGVACDECGIIVDEALHDASTDAYMTGKLLAFMALQTTSGEEKLLSHIENELKDM